MENCTEICIMTDHFEAIAWPAALPWWTLAICCCYFAVVYSNHIEAIAWPAALPLVDTLFGDPGHLLLLWGCSLFKSH